MKKHTLLQIYLPAALLMWGQLAAQNVEDIGLSDVVVIESNDSAPAEADSGPATVVEIPDAEIEGVTIDVEAPVIPDATDAIPGETEVVLEIPGQEAKAPGEATMETEESISVDFPDEDIRTILRNVADLFDLNLVIPDALQGRTSIKLKNVSWRQVFEEVLRQVNYTYVEDRNIIRITSIEELTTEPVDTRVFVVNFARANEIEGSISPLIDAAAGGLIRVDVRSNALVITERPSRMNKIQEIIDRLDQPNQQVMIESKFIEVTNADTKNVGVNWAFLQGYQASAGPFAREWSRERSSSTSTDSGLVDDSGFSSGEGVTFEDSTTFAEDFARVASTSRLDTAVFSAAEFNVVISALNQNNDSELVSNPTVITMDNTEAKIEIVTEVPQLEFEFNEETGTTRAVGLAEPLKFGTEILVTPQVNAAGFINLNITPEVSNQIGVQETDFGDQPILSSRRASTNVMIKDGYTLALGGLTQTEANRNGTRVPVLGDLPGIGRLFRSDADTERQRNLIIFITARTLNPDGSTYKEIIDPRTLDEMGITPAKLPGYQVPEEQLKQLQQLEDFRTQAAISELDEETKARIKRIKYAQQQADEERVRGTRK